MVLLRRARGIDVFFVERREFFFSSDCAMTDDATEAVSPRRFIRVRAVNASQRIRHLKLKHHPHKG